MKFDLNCDLGEGEGKARTAALMGSITSANVACGGHAGTARTMEECVRLVKLHAVRLGAHPGFYDLKNFGRVAQKIDGAGLELLLLQQVGALEAIARRHGVRLHHVKLHGALYHATEQSTTLAKAYLRVMQRWWPGLRVFALAAGTVSRAAKAAGMEVWDEAFLDRGYETKTKLRPRTEPGALVRGIKDFREQFTRLTRQNRVLTQANGEIELTAKTLCLHSDTPGSIGRARLARRWLQPA